MRKLKSWCLILWEFRILGFSNQWYKHAAQHKIQYCLSNQATINLIPAPYFIATKLEAFKNRGQNDYLASHDLEDVITVESLIPRDRTYKQHLSHYQSQTKLMGVCKLHGLRHAYAQRRYRELTRFFDPNKEGLICPVDGGKKYKEMSMQEKMIDQQARQILSNELGHSRVSVVTIYI